MSLIVERKGDTKRVESWDQLTQIEFLETFRKLISPWYDKAARYELMEWIYEKVTSEKFLVDELIVSKRFTNKTFKGPGKGFRDITMGQFMFADFYYFSYQNEKRPYDLLKMIATLFVDKNCQPDDLYDQKQIEIRAEELSSIPDHVQQAILFNYGAVRKWLTNQFTYVFPKKQPDSAPSKMPLPRWDKHIWKLADGASDYDFKKIADSRALNILKKLDELIEESEKNKNKKR